VGKISTIDYENIGARIKELRTKKKMSQAALAEAAHLSLPLISDIEHGKNQIQLSTFVKLAEALDVSTDFLLRLNVPASKEFYYSEFANILSDCTPTEIDSILQIVKEVKKQMHTKSNLSEY